MTEKIGSIKNPLTIIAIFAGIAEVSGTIILPFVAVNNQTIFIYFLICFPALLVLIFFLTLNFNNKVLYAPSDYKDESNYIKLFRYDSFKQEKVELDITSENQFQLLYEHFLTFDKNITDKIQTIEKKIIQSDSPNKSVIDKSLFEYDLSNMPRADEFVTTMKNKGYSFKIYVSQNEKENESINEFVRKHKSIWLGRNIPLEISKEVISEAKKFFPFLQFIHISGDLNDESPLEVYDQIFIGGSTSSAIAIYDLNPLSPSDFISLNECNTNEELFSFIRSFYSQSNF